MTTPASLLEADVPRPVLDVIARLRELGHAVFLVGGCVRDMLRGRPPQGLRRRHQRAPRGGPARLPQGHPHRHPARHRHRRAGAAPTSRSPPSAARATTTTAAAPPPSPSSRTSSRTCRAATSPSTPWRGIPSTHELVDPFGGQADLKAQHRALRGLGHRALLRGRAAPPARRALRRGARLHARPRLPRPPSPPRSPSSARSPTSASARSSSSCSSPRARPSGSSCSRTTGLLDVFLPELARADAEAARLARAAAAAAPVDVEIRLAALLGRPRHAPSRPREIGVRLKFPTKAVERVAAARRRTPRSSGMSGSRIPRSAGSWPGWGSRMSRPSRRWRGPGSRSRDPARLPGARRPHRPAAGPGRLEAAADARKELALNGGAIMATLGVGPSPIVGEATRFLLERVLDEPSLNAAGEAEGPAAELAAGAAVA